MMADIIAFVIALFIVEKKDGSFWAKLAWFMLFWFIFDVGLRMLFSII